MAPQKLEHTYTLFGSAPWGFRLSGGREFNQALVICRVTPGSVASRCGLEAGDIVKAVEGQFCNAMTQEMCQELVKSARGSLNITVEKPRNLNSNPDPTVYAPQDQTYNQQSLAPAQVVDCPVFDPNVMKKSVNKHMLMQGPGQSKVLHAQFNTPLDMYSNSNIVDVVQAQACAQGVAVPGSYAYENDSANINSSTFREVHRQHRPSQKSRQSRSFSMLQNIVGQ